MTDPTAEVVDWLASIGVAASAPVRNLPSSTARLVAIDGLVLRWYANTEFLEHEPDAIRREVAALVALTDSPVPAPRLVDWSMARPAAVLTTRLDGSLSLKPPAPEPVRELLDAIHAVEPGPLARWTYRGYHEGQPMHRPVWWRFQGVWERAVALTMAPRPSVSQVVLHRDFHPGNLLWSGGRISGVVDWVNACVGPAPIDAAHFRVNLATLHDAETADRILAADPAWDLEAALGYLDWWDPARIDLWVGPWPHIPPDLVRERLERFVGRAVAALG